MTADTKSVYYHVIKIRLYKDVVKVHEIVQNMQKIFKFIFKGSM